MTLLDIVKACLCGVAILAGLWFIAKGFFGTEDDN